MKSSGCSCCSPLPSCRTWDYLMCVGVSSTSIILCSATRIPRYSASMYSCVASYKVVLVVRVSWVWPNPFGVVSVLACVRPKHVLDTRCELRCVARTVLYTFDEPQVPCAALASIPRQRRVACPILRRPQKPTRMRSVALASLSGQTRVQK